MRAVLIALVAGCYHPANLAVCEVACTTTCPGQAVCGTDRLCHDSSCPLPVEDAFFEFEIPVDLGAPTEAGVICFGTGLVQVCLPAAPTTPYTFGNSAKFDTNTDPACTYVLLESLGTPVCVVAGTDVGVGENKVTTISGMVPLVIVATNTISVTGTLDAGSHRTTGVGAGAMTSCAGEPGVDGTSDGTSGFGTGGSGGAGGDFGTPGGAGGASAAGAGGAAGVGQQPTTLRGGCTGGAGGHLGSGVVASGYGGSGGGAIALIAPQITINGGILASGAGGTDGDKGVGGGGGGAGGMIFLDGTVMGSGSLTARGGGGGGATGANNTGQSGGDGDAGGVGGNGGPPGTAGANANTSVTVTAGGNGGGGGGGGGDGAILYHGTLGTGAYYPAATQN